MEAASILRTLCSETCKSRAASLRLISPFSIRHRTIGQSRCTLSVSATLGRPSRFPSRRARSIPAFTRSRRMARSSCAQTAVMPNMASPKGEVVSIHGSW